jgi:hypothetical protein
LNETNSILFVVSKSTGYAALKSFLEFRVCSVVSVLVLDDRNDARSCFDDILNLSMKHNIEPTVATEKAALRQLLQFKTQVWFLFVVGTG